MDYPLRKASSLEIELDNHPSTFTRLVIPCRCFFFLCGFFLFFLFCFFCLFCLLCLCFFVFFFFFFLVFLFSFFLFLFLFCLLEEYLWENIYPLIRHARQSPSSSDFHPILSSSLRPPLYTLLFFRTQSRASRPPICNSELISFPPYSVFSFFFIDIAISAFLHCASLTRRRSATPVRPLFGRPTLHSDD